MRQFCRKRQIKGVLSLSNFNEWTNKISSGLCEFTFCRVLGASNGRHDLLHPGVNVHNPVRVASNCRIHPLNPDEALVTPISCPWVLDLPNLNGSGRGLAAKSGTGGGSCGVKHGSIDASSFFNLGRCCSIASLGARRHRFLTNNHDGVIDRGTGWLATCGCFRKISAPVKPEIVAITDGDVDIDRPCACQQGRRLVGSDPIVAGYHLERFGRVE